jgi:hypothetical protein
MNKVREHIAFASIPVLSAGSIALGRSDKSSQVKELSLCDLVDKWRDYNRQKVRVRAIFRLDNRVVFRGGSVSHL